MTLGEEEELAMLLYLEKVTLGEEPETRGSKHMYSEIRRVQRKIKGSRRKSEIVENE